ncbi:Acid phosphatase PHO1 [Emericellopsis cladophorae]|uniref:Acid phosphatase PHO1 n=1 Tax=Emericellopsis cladophorae TaxID=2686198 RepID=A0A9Q0BGB3_9HYPO|nr:Acid phosphatase PHO1 [Emericellopsis cladophorae]KAI6783530.1 Acid phosphatase PHO1 [Emericellopsis cladophorae]
MAAQTFLKILTFTGSVSASTLYSTYNFNPLEHLAGIAPYFEPQDPSISPDAPQGCVAERAAYLVRHSAIYANDFDFETYIEPFLEKLDNKTGIKWNRVPDLSFLDDWEAPVSDDEVSILTRVGRLEATRLGVDINFRYPHLRNPKRVWTSSAERTVKAAQSLARGLQSDEESINVVEIPERSESGADSLTPYKACPGYSGSTGSDESSKFQERYAKPLAARFNELAPDFNFTISNIFGMQQLCGYETVIRGKSPFCDLDLFRPDDWLSWEYAEDVRYHYNVGYGNKVSGPVGLPWLNATAELLLDNDAGKDAEDLYVSFTHRELPPMVVVAMGLFNNSEFSGANNINETMPLDRINYRRAWKSSNIIPFLGNIALERFNCTDAPGYKDDEYYRVLVNSAPQSLPGCSDGPGTLCSRDGFKEYLEERMSAFDEGFSDACGVEYGNSTDALSIYTDKSVGNGTAVEKRYNAFHSE